jgi:hypothetical protein
VRVILAIGLFVASWTAACAQAVEGIDITEYGIYKTETESSAAAPRTATGKIEEVSNITLVESTTTVPARVGVEFGFRYKIIGQANAGSGVQAGATIAGQSKKTLNLKNVTHIPSPGIRHPQTGNVTMTSIFSQDHRLGVELYRLYRFTDPWEVVPGLWTLEIWDGDRKLASQAFLVKK